VSLASARTADEHDVARLVGELAAVELADLLLIDRRLGKLEAIQIAVQRELRRTHLVARLAFGILGLQQPRQDIERGARALDAFVDHFIKGRHHPMQAQGFESGDHFMPLHGAPP
jgi:hypothetical protein